MVLKYGIIVELSTLIDWKRYILKLAQIVTGLTSYASAAGMLLHVNGKLTVGKFISSLLS
jgi:hypothetical protein